MADQKVTQLTADTTPLPTDILPMVQDPSGTPVTKKVTIANLLATKTAGIAYTPSAAGTATLTLDLSNQHDVTMPAGNVTIALSGQTTGQKFTVSITQDSGGSRLVTWFTTIRWAGGSAPTLTTTASKRDIVGFIVTGANTYDGVVVAQNI